MAQDCQDPALCSWIEIPPNSHFSLANIPLGIFSTYSDSNRRVGTVIGNHVFDISGFFDNEELLTKVFYRLSRLGPPYQLPDDGAYLLDLRSSVKRVETLNKLAGRGRAAVSALRKFIQNLFVRKELAVSENQQGEENGSGVGSLKSEVEKYLTLDQDVEMHLPFNIGDYTDFYAGLHHAVNCGRLLRGPGNELQPNYKHTPVGYHGRASSIVVSGTPIARPAGQILPHPGSQEPVLSACKRLDFELELGCFVGKPSALGSPISLQDAKDHLFGVVLLNDWSARDIQTWEMVPLGPFNAKNFATSISPWVVTFDALEPFLVPPLEASRPLLPHLRSSNGEDGVFAGSLEVSLKPNGASDTQVVTKTESRNLIFSFAQMLAHHSVNGCPFRTGDLLGSGTISGQKPGTFGSLLEQTNGGKNHISVAGEQRTFLQDGDEIVITGVCGDDPYGRVGFGECRGVITKTKCPENLLGLV